MGLGLKRIHLLELDSMRTKRTPRSTITLASRLGLTYEGLP